MENIDNTLENLAALAGTLESHISDDEIVEIRKDINYIRSRFAKLIKYRAQINELKAAINNVRMKLDIIVAGKRDLSNVGEISETGITAESMSPKKNPLLPEMSSILKEISKPDENPFLPIVRKTLAEKPKKYWNSRPKKISVSDETVECVAALLYQAELSRTGCSELKPVTFVLRNEVIILALLAEYSQTGITLERLIGLSGYINAKVYLHEIRRHVFDNTQYRICEEDGLLRIERNEPPSR